MAAQTDFEVAEREGFIEDLAGLLAGVQVPMSMGVLGAAREPAIALKARLGDSFGWTNKESLAKALDTYLAERGWGA